MPYVTNNYRLLISFAVFTGCRVGETLGAAWSHIDWKSGQFHVSTVQEVQFYVIAKWALVPGGGNGTGTS